MVAWGPAALMAGGSLAGSLLGGSKKGKVKIPYEARMSLADLLELAQSGTPSIPQQGIAGLSEAEGKGQELLKGYLGTGTSGTYDAAKAKILDYINQPGDISELPEYQSIVRTAKLEGNEAVNQVMRRMQMGGMSQSTPQGKAVGREVGRTMENITGRLAPYAEGERNRTANMVNTLLQMGQYEEALPLQKVGAAAQYGSLPRNLQQAVLDAIFQKKSGETMFPYNQGLNVYRTILGAPGSEPQVFPPAASTGFSNAMGGATSMAQLLPYIFPGTNKASTQYGKAA